MKIIKNEKLIARNGKIGQWLSFGALLVLGGGMYISFNYPAYSVYSFVCLIVGFIMTQVGMYMGNRWGRSPRPDEKLDTSLKGLHSEFNMYHYSSPVSHLLVGPAGVWVLLPYHQGGQVSYEKNRWKNKGGGFFQSYMRIFGQDSLGRPDIEADSAIQVAKKFFTKYMDESAVPEVKVALVFTHEQVELEAGEAPLPAMKLKQLKDFIRQMSKTRALTNSQISEIIQLLPKE